MFRLFASSTYRVASQGLASQTRFTALAAQTSSFHFTSLQAFSDAVKNGTVKWFDGKKGFGFIVPDDGSEDIFVHQSAIHAEGFRSLAEGEPVEFSVVTDNGRSKAENVTGPMGAFVQGAPRRAQMDYDGNRGGFGGDKY